HMTAIRAKLGAQGRVVIPASVRAAVGLKPGDEILISVEDEGVRIATVLANLRRVQKMLRPYKPKQGLASDELIAERRREVAAEERGRRGRS
ncbi:MAG: AbrB/MazE/SpoVT family DNA-binding domain-containing protein, partial [Alphaproteobacteria bacterium]|nr:AbrB/MazE/SpoVT family DNA-binding domain-containing protein [Alphaproteobacteria bacterium]